MQKKLSNIFLVVVITLFAVNCANRGMPQGGEKDTEPPKVIKSEPENYSTNFSGKEIKIYFDEYIKLKNLQKQLIISPPMKTQPEILPLGGASKRITIKIFDTLQPNMTYAFNFGQSVVDNNEENPFSFYRFVISTGDYIDSLTVSGQIYDAEKRKPEEFVSVMLYEKDTSYTDSIVYKEFPKYVTNTLDSTTTFTLENLKAGTYKLIALKDENLNNKYDQSSDKIGFMEGFITIPTDSIYSLNLFKEEQDFKATRASQVSGSKIAFGYVGNPENMDIELISDKPESFRYRIIRDSKADTLYYWHTPKFDVDSIIFNITNNVFNYKKDSMVVKIKDMYKDSLVVDMKPKSNIAFNEELIISGSTPLDSIDKSLITFINKDSSNIEFGVEKDLKHNSFIIQFKKEESEAYNIQLLPGAIKDMFDNTNDTITQVLRTKTLLDYGNLRVLLQNVKYPIIIQLTDDKGEVLAEKYSEKQEPVDFNFLSPKKYFVRVVFDDNGNKKWDSGDFIAQQQPERISYYPSEVDIRAGWDEAIQFTLLE